MPQSESRVEVYSVEHLHDLILRRKKYFHLEAIVQPSGELRKTDLFIDWPSKNYGTVQGAMVTDNFSYDIAIRVLEDKGEKWQAKVYCPGDWNAHDIAAETEKWGV